VKRNRFLNFISLLTAAALFAGALTGCGADADQGQSGTPDDGAQLPDSSVSDTPSGTSQKYDGRFTLRFMPEFTLNPFTGTDSNNMQIASLMYEGLFMLDDGFAPQPVLCESWETEDGITYTLKLRSGIAMSDGSSLTADDAAYSINQARSSSKYKNRLKSISSCIVSDPLTIIITLYSADFSLPALLDTPIVKTDTAEDDLPVGTGPYTMSGTDRLQAFSKHRDYAELPISVIYLSEFGDSLLSESFAEHKLDLLLDDTGDDNSIVLRGNYEARRYSTTILQYVGFNAASAHLDDPRLRRAMSFAVDRASIIEDVYDGCGESSVLILPPSYGLYDELWEDGLGYSMKNMSAQLADIGMSDWSGDLYLEYPADDGFFNPVSFRFIVNDDSRNKVEAAERITQNLRSIGLDVTLEVLPWDDYIYRLNTGEFELYYAEVSLTPNFDLSMLLQPGGSLDYGTAGGAAYDILNRAFLCAETAEDKKAAAKNLCLEIASSCPIVPVLYREYAIYTHRGVVVGAAPSASSIFSGFTGWDIRMD